MIFLLFIESNFYLILLFTESKNTYFLITANKKFGFLTLFQDYSFFNAITEFPITIETISSNTSSASSFRNPNFMAS